jgi:hypothetical protein
MTHEGNVHSDTQGAYQCSLAPEPPQMERGAQARMSSV